MTKKKLTDSQKQKRINDSIDRMCASIDRTIGDCKEINRGLDILLAAHQPESEHFRREHLKGDLSDSSEEIESL